MRPLRGSLGKKVMSESLVWSELSVCASLNIWKVSGSAAATVRHKIDSGAIFVF